MARSNLHVSELVSPDDILSAVRLCRDMDRKAFEMVYPNTDFRSFIVLLMRSSHVFSVKDDGGNFMAMFGLFNATKKLGMTWMFSTDDARKYSIEFARKSKKIFDEFKMIKREIRALVFKEDKTSLKWHKWLGFAIIKENELSYEMALKGRMA